MKKVVKYSVLSFLLLMLLVSLVISVERSEITERREKEYIEENRTLTIRNQSDSKEVATARLITETEIFVPRGYNKVGEIEITGRQGIENILQSISLHNVKDAFKVVDRQIDLKRKTITSVRVDDYDYVVNDTLKNGTIIYNYEKVGSHFEDRVTWQDLSRVDVTKDQKIIIGLFTDVKEGDKIDWIPTIANVEVKEWAKWSESIVVGLEYHYKFDETSGTIAVDFQNNINGTINETTIGQTGKINNAYIFGDKDSREHVSFTSQIIDQGNFTFIAWIKPDEVDADTRRIVAEQTSNTGWDLSTKNGELTYTNSGTGAITTSGAGVVAGEWNFIAINITQDNKISFWINGSIISSHGTPTTHNGNGNTLIGARRSDFAPIRRETFNGSIDEVFIFERSLSIEEVEAIYNEGDGLELDYQPELILNETIPNSPNFGDTTYFNITAKDRDNDDITDVFFTLLQPNGSTTLSQSLGNHVDGFGYLGQNETWNSTSFIIPNTTGAVGQWNYTYLIVTNGSFLNDSFTGSFTLTDSDNPTISIINPQDNDVYQTNISIPLNYILLDNIEIDSCWYSLDGGSTNNTISDCSSNTSFQANTGTYNLSLFLNDTSGNEENSLIQNITLNLDTLKPNVTIVSPSGTLSSKTINIDIDVEENGITDMCIYNITRGASTEVSNTEISNCNTTSVLVSSDADYVIMVFVNDTQGNFNVTSKSFSVDTGGVGGGGGGGSSTTIISGEKGWEMSVGSGSGKYEVGITPGARRTLNVNFINKGDSSRTITLSCEDLEGTPCDFVTFKETTFNLALLTDTTQSFDFYVDFPDDLEVKDYSFNIKAIDDLGKTGSVTVFLSDEGFLTRAVSKLFATTKGGFPYFLIFLGSLIVTIIGTAIVFKKVPGRPIWVAFLSFSLSTFILLIF